MYSNNFYNPYMYNNFVNNQVLGRTIPRITKSGFNLNNLFKKFSFTGFLSGASKTLNVVNQAIPIYYQVKPMISNAKTMFKVMKAVKTPDYQQSQHKTNAYNIKSEKNTSTNSNYSSNGNPTFFL